MMILSETRLVCGTISERVQERLLREDELTLDKAISGCRADEESKTNERELRKNIEM